MSASSASSGLYRKRLWKELMVRLSGNYPFPSVWKIDHHLTTTMQWHYKMPEKPVVTTNNGLFLFWLNCAEPTKLTVHRRSTPPCRSSPTPKARGSNPPGRTKSSTLWGAALFVLHGFYGAVKEGIRTARAPRFGKRSIFIRLIINSTLWDNRL